MAAKAAKGRDGTSEQGNLSANLELETPWEAEEDGSLQDTTKIFPFPLR